MENTELESALRAMSSSKVTEKKNGASSLENLLKSERFTKVLDHNSEHSTHIGWNVVFKVVNEYFEAELLNIQNANNNVSAATITMRQRKKQDLISLLKLVVKAATSKGTPYLKLSRLINIIKNGLTEPYLLQEFGQDFVSLLHKRVLKVRKYWLDMTSDQWNELLKLLCKFYLNDKIVDRTLLASTIQDLIEGSIKQGNVDTDDLLDFFQNALNLVSEMQPSTQVENLVTALNMFSYSVAASSRHRLCTFGHNTMKLLLTLWGKVGTEKNKLKDELIKQLHLQLAIHHPKGQETLQDDCAYDGPAWKNHLESLHDSIVSHIDSVSTRQKFLPGHKSKAVDLTEDLIFLTRDIYKQLPHLIPSSGALVTVDGRSEDEEDTSAKRARLCPSGMTLLELIKIHSNTLQVVPWLQVLTSLLEMYPAIFDQSCIRHILQSLSTMLTDCTLIQLFKPLFDALTALTRIFIHRGSSVLPETLKEWQTVWTASLSKINSSHAKVEGCQENGFILMSSILQLNLLRPGKEIWNLFLPDYCKPTSASASLLISLLQSQTLPENYFPNILGLSKDANPFPLRRLLLQWLMSEFEESESLNDLKHKLCPSHTALLCLSLLHKDPAHMLEKSGVLKTLIEKESSPKIADTSSGFELVLRYTNENTDTLGDLESLFLKRDFVKVEAYIHARVKQETSDEMDFENSNPLMVGMLDSFVKMLVTCLPSNCQKNQTDSFIIMTQRASFLLSVIQRLGCHVTQMQEMCALAKSCIETCTQFFLTAITNWDDSKFNLPQFIQALIDMIRVDDILEGDPFWKAEFVRSCLPSDFVDWIIDLGNGKEPIKIIIEKEKPGRRNRYSSSLDKISNASQRQSERSITFDSDMDFDMTENGDGEGDVSSPHGSHGITNFLHPSRMRDAECVRFLCVKLLCELVKFDKRKAPKDVEVQADLNVDDIHGRIMEMISPDNFHPKEVLHVLNFLTITQDLLTPRYFVSSFDMKQIFVAFRSVAKQLSKDWQVTMILLRHLCYVVPHLHGDQLVDPPDSLLSCRNFFFKFVTDFGILCSNTSNDAVKMQYVYILLELLKYDPTGIWGKVEIDDGDDEEDEIKEECAADVFVKYLEDDSVKVGMLTAEGLRWLFINWSETDLFKAQCREKQLKALENILSVFSQILNKPVRNKKSSVHNLRKKDIESSRLDVCLTGAMTVICHSSVVEKECLLWICRAVATWDIPINNIVKMLKMVCISKHCPNVNMYLANHLPYLLHHWINRYKTSLQEFPFKLLGYDTFQDFISCHLTTIVSIWFATSGELNNIKSVLTSVQCDIHQALLTSLPHILVHVLPCLVEEPNSCLTRMTEDGNSASYNQAQKCYSLLKLELSETEINECVSNRLSEITVLTLGCLHMESNKTTLPMPDPNPPSYNRKEVQATLDHLAKVFPLTPDERSCSLVTVLAKIPSGIHSVLLSIATNMSKQCCGWERLRCMQMYDLFVGMVMEELPGGLEGGWAATLRDIINWLVSILQQFNARDDRDKEFENEIGLTCLECLKSVCQIAIENCPDEFAKYLHQIMDSMATSSQRDPTLVAGCVSLVESLVKWSRDGDQDLVKAWKTVGLLPDIPGFRNVNEGICSFRRLEGRPLILRLQDVMEVSSNENGGHNNILVQEIDRLTAFIIQHPKDIGGLLKTPPGRVSLRKMCFLLLQLLTTPSKGLVNASARCLGAIGPIDLHTLSYCKHDLNTPRTRAMDVYKDVPMEKYCWLFHFLDSCLTDENLDVVKVAGDILTKVMSAQAANRFQDDYGHKMRDVSFLFHYLQPFQGKKKERCMAPPKACVTSESVQVLNNLDLWNPCDPVKSHKDWIQNLTNALLTAKGVIADEILSEIGPMCTIKTSMCEESLPYLVHNALEADESGLCRKILSQGFGHFFREHCQRQPQGIKESLPVCLRKESIRVMLNVVQYLRKQKRRQQSTKRNTSSELTPFDNNFWLDLDYLQVAKAAEYCQANCSAFLFTEIWWDIFKYSQPNNNSDSQSSISSSQGESSIHPLSLVSQDNEMDHNIQSFLLSVSRGIGDFDLLYGCGAGRRPEANSRVLTYLQEQEQSKALTSLDIEARHSGSGDTPLVLLQTIQSCGADHLLIKCLDGLDRDNDARCLNEELEEFRYKTAWRLGQWDDLGCPSSKDISEGLPYHQAVYCALSSLRENHLDVANLAIQSARKTCIMQFDPKIECSQSLYPFLSQLQCLSVLEELVSQLKTDQLNLPYFMPLVLEEESDGLSLLDHMKDFSCEQNLLEMLVSSASVIKGGQLKTARLLEGRALWRLMVCSRQAARFQDSEKAMWMLKTGLSDFELGASEDSLQFEEARLYWARNEVNIALDLLKSLVRKLKRPRERQNASLLPEALATYGNWLDKTRSESPTVIMKDFLEKSVSLIDGSSSQNSPTFETSVECFVSLARFADAQYQQISDYMASPVYKEKKDLLQRTQTELKECHEYKRNNKYLLLMEKNANIDKVELESLERDHAQFLEQALFNYLRCLQDGNMHDVKVFRVVALWFENASQREVNQVIQDSCKRIATYKFLPLYYQLAARMSTQQEDGSEFQAVLIQQMERVAKEHPHHTLWIVMALAHANKDDQMQAEALGSSKKRRKVPSDKDEVVEEGRVQAAKEMLDRLKQERLSSSLSVCREGLGQVVRNMEELSLAYIQLANKNVSEHKNERKPIPLDTSLKLCKIKDLSGILIPSVDLKVEIDGDYSQAPYPVSYASTFKLAGGVNLPKIIVCRGSDGVNRTQLVKGKDDLRQDAVMQQVFALVNQLLMADPETKKRELNIRTYKVVPLTQKCGLLEWCEGTQPMGQYLVGNIQKTNDGAHAKYRPKDWSAMQCRLHLQRAKSDPKDKMKAYLEICANFKPVFRHFFMETFKDPATWFQKRLAYTRSVATNSIVGYILGLGDRHVQNILIDMKTAEMIHIDLGIAFEMGHTLPTPETVPFRLTRDTVDGMGIVGVEGVFRRCCEKTMQVMRNNGELLLTIVQVLMYDPLSHWALTPQLMLAIQKKREQAVMDNQDSIMASGSVPSSFQQRTGSADTMTRTNGEGKEKDSKMAERTLLRLKQKLSGVEDGAQLGLEGQVNCLIQQASDPKNLSCLFAGWQPYL